MRTLFGRSNGTRDAVLSAIESGQDSAAAVIEAAAAHKRMCETIEVCAYTIVFLFAVAVVWAARDGR